MCADATPGTADNCVTSPIIGTLQAFRKSLRIGLATKSKKRTMEVFFGAMLAQAAQVFSDIWTTEF